MTGYPTLNQPSEVAGSWTNPNNAHANDTVYATATPGKNQTFGSIYRVSFTSAEVPDGVTITSTLVEIEYRVSTTASVATFTSQLYSDSGRATSLSATFTDTSEPTTDTIVSYSATTQPTIAELRSGIWVDLLAGRTSNTVATFSADFVRVTVTFSDSTTIGNGLTAEPTASTSCPGTALTDLDNFTLKTTGGSDTINSLTVTLAPAGAFNNVGTLTITNDAGTTTYATVTNPGTNTVTFNSFSPTLTAGTNETQYHVRIQPKAHASMPAVPGASYDVTGTVTAATHSAATTLVYADSTSGTITLDNASPGDASWGTVTPGDASVSLAWANPGDADFSQVVILRSTASISNVPVEGTTYTAGNTIGASTVRYVGNGTSTTDATGLVNGTDYWYKVFAKDTCGNYAAGIETGPHRPAPATTTTVGPGTNPGDASICPGGSATPLDGFSLQTSAGTDTVTSVTVDFAAGTNAALSLVEITNVAGTIVYGSFTNPGDPQAVALTTNITANTTLTEYRVRVTPKSHVAMPVPPGTTSSVTGTVSALASANTKAYNDSTSSTVTIDNASPGPVTGASCSAVSSSQVNLAWTNPGTDFQRVVVVRGPAGGACPTFAPTEGTVYSTGSQGSDTIVFVGNAASYSDTGLAASTSYCWEIWTQDPCGNFDDAPVSNISCSTPAAPIPPVTPGVASAVADTCTQATVSAPFTGDTNTNSTTAFRRGPTAGGPWTDVSGCSSVTGASPRTCVDTAVPENSTWFYQVDFTDADGVSGTDPQVTSSVTTPPCAPGTAAGTSTAVASSCRQITVLAKFTGDGDGDGTTLVQISPAGAGTWTTVCASLSGGSPRNCLATGLSPSTAYDIRVDHTDPDGVSGTDPQTIANVTTPACGTDTEAPTLLILSPARNAVVGGTEGFKVQVFDFDGTISLLEYSVDGGAATSFLAGVNNNYSCGTGCKVYEFSLSTTALAAGDHDVTVRARDNSANEARIGTTIRVANSAGAAAGSGTILRRSHGSQLCVDCHNLATHSSQYSSRKYGNWALDCLACHTPHKTRNIELIRETISTPNSGPKTIAFQVDDRAGGTNPQNSYLGAFTVDANATPVDDGVCEACHTKTTHYRNTAAGSDHTHARASRCVSCHTHGEGFAGGACDKCHGAPSANGAHPKHYALPSIPTTYEPVTNNSTTTAYGFACGKCHSGAHGNDTTHAGTAGDPYQVEVNFDATTSPKNPGGTYVQVWNDATQAGNGAPPDYWSWTSSTTGTNGRCSNLYCHSNANPVGGTNAFAAVQWNQGSAGWSCTSCHDTAGAASGLSNAHRLHTDPAKYAFGCVRCHVSTVSGNTTLADKSKHVNEAKDVVFDSSGVNNSGATYDSGARTCTDSYCHSSGQDTVAPYSSGASLAWTSTTTCRSCHGGNASAAPTMASGKHAEHVNNVAILGTNFGCYSCHAATVSTDTAISGAGWAQHVDGGADLAFALGGTWTKPNCTNAYCHSSGQAVAAPIQYYSVDWTTGTLGCNGCHGRHVDNAFVPTAGEPNYTNAGAGLGKANSHRKHVLAATDCADCHDDTTATGASIKAGSVFHLDGTRTVAIAAAWDTNGGTKSDNYNAGTKTCSSIKCHATQSPSPVWGGPTPGCRVCHMASGAGDQEVDDYTWKNGVQAAIDAENWTTYGHGLDGGLDYPPSRDASKTDGSTKLNRGADFDNGGADNGCLYCHDSAIDHNDTTNPFRLVRHAGHTGNTATDKNWVCLVCHSSGDPGFDGGPTVGRGIDSSLDIDTAHSGYNHTGGTPGTGKYGGTFCWDCHDPHGDYDFANSRVFASMIERAPTSQNSGSAGPTDWGIPTTLATTPNFNVSTDGNAAAFGWGDYARSTATSGTYRGICQVCHTVNNKFNALSTDAWDDEPSHFPTKPGCGSGPECHNHRNNFNQKKCNECHQAPPRPGGTGTNNWTNPLDRHKKHYERDALAEPTALPTTFDDLTGAATATQYAFACGKCHSSDAGASPSPVVHFNDVAHDGTAGNGFDVQVAFDTTTAPANPGGLYSAEAWASRAEDSTLTDGRRWTWSDTAPGGACSNLYCHSNANPVGGVNRYGENRGGAGAAPYYWHTTTLACTGCHEVTGATAASQPQLSQRHTKHISGGTTAYGFTCDECHATVIADDSTSTLIDKRQHVDGGRDVAFSATAFATDTVNQSAGGYASYQCTNTYCHSQGQSTTAPFGGAPNAAVTAWQWNTGTVTCESCHGGNASATAKITNGAHDAHTNQTAVIGSNFACFRCHEETVSSASDTALHATTGTTKHVNALRDVNPSDDTTTSWNGTTCSTNYCHSNGTETLVAGDYATVPAWASGSLTGCAVCHGTEGGSIAGEPRYANNTGSFDTRNSHLVAGHVTAATDCVKCHDSTVTAAGALEVGGTSHLNATRNVDNATFISTYNESTETCTTVCHGGNSVVWGDTTISCRSCHMKAGAGDMDVDDFTNDNLFNDGVGVASAIDAEDWATYGHGAASAFAQSGNPGPNFDSGGRDGCLYCHTKSVNHFDAGGNIFRLANTGGADGKNGNCLVCHKTGSTGYNPGTGLVNRTTSTAVNANHYGGDHSTTGDGGQFCWDCHDPHGDYNYTVGNKAIAYMIHEFPVKNHDGNGGATGWGIPDPATGWALAVDFNEANTGGATTFDWGDYVDSTATGGNYNGVCQVCHTSTNTLHFRQTLYDAGHNATQRCTASCHKHDQPPSDAFKPAGGGDCLGCHGSSTQGPRRAVSGDFANGTSPAFRSHHVGNGTTTVLQGTLTNFDCVVCHAEGTVTAGATATTAKHNDGLCANGKHCIDLYNADNTATTYAYDKRSICMSIDNNATNCDTPGWVGTVASWGSNDATWASQMQNNLDPFCLSCHDANGASATYLNGETGASAHNPFLDSAVSPIAGTGHITNNRDQIARGSSIIDIDSMVNDCNPGEAGRGCGGDADGDLDGTILPNPSAGNFRAADGRRDPPQGIFSRHAIRGQSVSPYGTNNANWSATTYWQTGWSQTSVMACADCHTSDGANGSAGNAHGSDAEYLLKNSSGGAAEPTKTTYVCIRCHASYYNGTPHTGNGGDYVDTLASAGNRSGGNGNFYGMACFTCHGGVQDRTGTRKFGTIHGTSQQFNITTSATNYRNAYRFTNGNSMRFYDPQGWTGLQSTCSTLGSADTPYGGCTKHSGAGTTRNKNVAGQRPLSY